MKSRSALEQPPALQLTGGEGAALSGLQHPEEPQAILDMDKVSGS
jgi:hypothetical protein